VEEAASSGLTESVFDIPLWELAGGASFFKGRMEKGE
jgi:hypothetical protein